MTLADRSTVASGFALENLPFDNSFARLPGAFHTRLAPIPLPDPYLVAASERVAALIGLAPEELRRPEFVETFIGNRPLPGAEPLAAVYSGHQFGVWAGRLGDGRAHLLGEIRGEHGPWEIQLKGAGGTPYSRFADGRAVLRSSIREFLCSEAVAGLGIPTTRALCVVGSDSPVVRETVETAAVVTRVAPSFVRFGSFEHWNSLDRELELRLLADYVIDRFRPALGDESRPYEALLADVSRRTAELVAHWQAVGFMHGVMNTDNMSILGLTLDYGPFGFMEAFDAGHICNHSDHHGRYSFRNQPRVAHWNLYALGDALRPLIGQPERVQELVDDAFATAFEEKFRALMRAKLGFVTTRPEDGEFIGKTLGLLQMHRPDYTLFFRGLSRLSAQASSSSDDGPVLDHFIDRAAAQAWLALWRQRLAIEGSQDEIRQPAMCLTNPKYILRNWMAESAIRRARKRDFSEVTAILRCLEQPFAEQPEFEAYAALPPDWANGLSVSCSS